MRKYKNNYIEIIFGTRTIYHIAMFIFRKFGLRNLFSYSSFIRLNNVANQEKKRINISFEVIQIGLDSIYYLANL